MITADDIKKAYEVLLSADENQFHAEEARIEAAQVRERAYLMAMEEAIADGVRDQAILQKKGEKGSRKQLQKLQQKEKESRAAAHQYRQAGILVDSLNRQIEAEKVSRQKD